MANYRPISLTSVVCKVMEKIILDSLLDFLRLHGLLSGHQHGFLARRSTCSQLLECLNDWTLAADRYKKTDIIYIDFAKAFDKVSHSKLLTKLSGYGIKSQVLRWITDFLSQRTQRVVVDGVLSDPKDVISGVIQGSVMGPLLFIIYINDLPDTVIDHIMAKLFADDGKEYGTRDYEEQLEESLRNFSEWAEIWQMDVSPDKCAVLSVGNRNVPPRTFEFKGEPLPMVTYIRDLGVTVSSDLKFSRHCSEISSKAYIRASLILRIFRTTCVETLINAYTTFVRPIMESCTQVFNPYLLGDIRRIERVQRFYTRAVLRKCELPPRSYAERLTFFKMESLEYRRLLADIYMTFKLVRGLVDVNVHQFFRVVHPTYNLRRNSVQLRADSVSHVDCRQFYFSNRVVGVWNSLSDHVVTAPSLAAFKRRLRKGDGGSYNLSDFCLCFSRNGIIV